ncbi:MAG: hypothetical protein ABI537_02160 [Casimicrobiaceae bacterium]
MRLWSIAALLLVIPGASRAAASCARPDTAFYTFLTQFANDRQFQLDRIVYPLRVFLGDATIKAPASEKWDRQRVTKLAPPLLVPGSELRAQGLKQSARQVDSKRIEVIQSAAGAIAGRRLFMFELRSKCWYLTSYTALKPRSS